MTRFEVVRDPLWNNIRLDPEALAVVDTPAVQRLRYVRQLGHAFLVYPGATHSRFEHALGAYHLARRVLDTLEDAGDVRPDSEERARLKLAALLHDIGHYPFSHALEEAGLPRHEALAARHLTSGALADRLTELGTPAERLLPLIRGEARGPLVGLVAGSLHVPRGSSSSSGIPGTCSGTSSPNTGSGAVGVRSSVPASAARTIARVRPRRIRSPTPYGPPLQPVFTSQHCTPCCAIFSPRSAAYTLGLSGRNGAPKQAEKVAFGSVTPRSVPATLAV